MLKLTGLWLNVSGKGEKYFTGNLGNARVVIMKNTFKVEGSNEPDYTLYLDEPRKKVVGDILEDDIPQ